MVPSYRTPDTAVVEAKFADHWDLPESGSLEVGGATPIDYTGLGMIPDDFFYEGPEGSVLSQGDLAPVYVSLERAQALTGRTDQVNDLVLTIAADGDRDVVEAELEEGLAAAGLSATILVREDSDAIRVLYEDIDNDQRFWNALAALILGAASLAAFNLLGRIVEAQRREIGIGMALGLPRRYLAIRPMAVGVQVAVLGTLGGIGVGWLIGIGMADLLRSFLPLPIYLTDFQPTVFAQAAVLGLALPLLAAALPVWRAVRVEPIEAIRVGHLAATSNRPTSWTAKLPIRGSTLTLMPLRNALRSPRRTILTAIGVGAAITALVAVLGLLDSFGRAVDVVGEEVTKGSEERVLVQLDTFYAPGSPTIAAIEASDVVATVDTTLRLPAIAVGTEGDAEPLALIVDVLDLDDGVWSPTLNDAGDGTASGFVLTDKAIDDLGVSVGETITMSHPQRQPDGTFLTVESTIVVGATHVNPLRPLAYLDRSEAALFGFVDEANLLQVVPMAGATSTDVQRAVFGADGVTSSQAVQQISSGFDEALEQFVGILAITALAVLVLAGLIAFNAARVGVAERQREHATMRAFGYPVRSIMTVVLGEGLIVGVLASIIGIGGGIVFLDWMLASVTSTTLPDFAIARAVSSTTFGLALTIGIAAALIAPLFLTRRISRMNIPDALRIME